MTLATLRREVGRLRELAGRQRPALNPVLQQTRRAAAATMRLAGLPPDPWQPTLLRSAGDRQLVLTTRQAGKSQTVAALALNKALLIPRALVLLLSPSERQSGELAQKVFAYYDSLDKPVPARKRTEL